MIYLVTQMLLCIALAALAGGAVGWLIQRSRANATLQTLRATIVQQRAQVEQARTDVSLISQDYDELKHRSRDEIERLQQENKRLPALNQNLEKSQTLVRQLMQKHEAQLRDLGAEKDALAQRLATLTDREDAYRRVSAELDGARRRLVTLDASQAQASIDAEPVSDDDASSTASSAQPIDGTAAADPVDDGVAAHADDHDDADASAALLRSIGLAFDTAPAGDSADDADSTPDESDEHATDSTASEELPAEKSVEQEALDAMEAGAANDPDNEVADAQSDASQSAASHDVQRRESDAAARFGPVDQHDDLKQIFGIGPVTEKALNELGITSYSQLAELQRHDIETIAQALQIFPSRIERDDWVGNARRQLEDVLEQL